MPHSMVLTERDYTDFVIYLNKLEERDIIPSILRKGLSTSSLLFIGYTLEDISFRGIYQGFLSFLNSLPSEFRRLSIVVQDNPRNYNTEDVIMQKYLEQYTRICLMYMYSGGIPLIL